MDASARIYDFVRGSNGATTEVGTFTCSAESDASLRARDPMKFATSSSGVANDVTSRTSVLSAIGRRHPVVELRAGLAQPCAFVIRHAREHRVGLDRIGDLDAFDAATVRAASCAAPARWRGRRVAARDHPPDTPRAAPRRNASSTSDGPIFLRRYSKSRASSGSKNTTASAASAPFLVAPKESTSTPLRQVMSAGVQPRPASALAKRAPSMCSFMPCACASALICRDFGRRVDRAEFGGLGHADRGRLGDGARSLSGNGRAPLRSRRGVSLPSRPPVADQAWRHG